MMFDERHGSAAADRRSGTFTFDWKSVAAGAAATFVIAYACVVRPARQQLDLLEQRLGDLGRVVTRLEAAEGDVSATGRLLAALEAQARRADAAGVAVQRFAALHERLAAQSGMLEAAAETVAHVESLRQGLDAIDRRGLDAAQAAAERMVRLGDTLAAQAADLDAAQSRLDRFVRLKSDLVHHGGDLDAAEITLGHLHDLTDWLARSATVVGDLRHFVVDVMLLQPSVERARHALEPVVALAREAGRTRPGDATADATAGTITPPNGAEPSATDPAAKDPPVIEAAAQPPAATSR
jgi:hypothetical protein